MENCHIVVFMCVRMEKMFKTRKVSLFLLLIVGGEGSG